WDDLCHLLYQFEQGNAEFKYMVQEHQTTDDCSIGVRGGRFGNRDLDLLSELLADPRLGEMLRLSSDFLVLERTLREVTYEAGRIRLLEPRMFIEIPSCSRGPSLDFLPVGNFPTPILERTHRFHERFLKRLQDLIECMDHATRVGPANLENGAGNE
ncbi:hypothetical protein QAD02_000289, partial [Eretmocerus hayati]